MAVKILTVCGAGIGTSEILRVTASRALQRLGIEADVTATDAEHVHELAEDAQVVLATSENVAPIGRTYAQVIVIDNILDQSEVEAKLADALEFHDDKRQSPSSGLTAPRSASRVAVVAAARSGAVGASDTTSR